VNAPKPLSSIATELARGVRIENNQWVDACFAEIWQHTVKQFKDQIAIVDQRGHHAYQDLALEAETLSVATNAEGFVPIDGSQSNWLVYALAAWCRGLPVMFYSPEDPDPANGIKANITPDASTHAVFFTSGSTGQPKAVLRSNALALYEAQCYAQDLTLSGEVTALCLVKPWFGAMTKHVLGCLLNGVRQCFSVEHLDTTMMQSLVYGTPSQVTQLPSTLAWDLISLTGEPVNASQLPALRARLTTNGVVHDALGATECGVIARRWVSSSDLTQLAQGFNGAVLAGKKLSVDDQGALSVALPGQTPLATGDLVRIDGDHLTLRGRISALRKVHGRWIDATPLLQTARSLPFLSHVELAPESDSAGRLHLNVIAHPPQSADSVLKSIFLSLDNLQLLPVVTVYKDEPLLGKTGKRRIKDLTPAQTGVSEPFATSLAALFIQWGASLPADKRGRSLAELGLDSLDITALAAALQQQSGEALAERLTAHDTLAHVMTLLSGSNPIREWGQSDAHDCLICLGRGMSLGINQTDQPLRIIYHPGVRSEAAPFELDDMARAIADYVGRQNITDHSSLKIAGFSLDAVLAVEVCYRLELQGIAPQGLFLLDPPTAHRRRWQYWRYRLLGRLLLQLLPRHSSKYPKEWRRRIIARQPPRRLTTPVTVVSLFAKASPWLTRETAITQQQLPKTAHQALVRTDSGKDSWRRFFQLFLRDSRSKFSNRHADVTDLYEDS